VKQVKKDNFFSEKNCHHIKKKKYKCMKIEVSWYVTPFILVDGYLSHYGDSLKSQV